MYRYCIKVTFFQKIYKDNMLKIKLKLLNYYILLLDRIILTNLLIFNNFEILAILKSITLPYYIYERLVIYI